MKKRKQFLSLLLTLCMVITMLPVPALAGGIEQTVYTYAEFKQAMSNAQTSGGIITLGCDIANVTTDQPYTFTGNSGVTITIDGNGHTITGPPCNYESSSALSLEGAGTVILKNITLQGGTSNSYMIGWTYGLVVGGAINVREDITSSATSTVKGGDANGNDGTSCGLYYKGGSGTVNITNAIGGKGKFASIGVYYCGPGTVNIVNATGADGVMVSKGVLTSNYSDTIKMGTINVVNATGGKATSLSCGVEGVGTGTVNVTNAIGGEAPVRYSIYGSNGIINAANTQGTTFTTNATINNASDKVTTLKLYKGAGATCILDKVTIAKTGTPSIGTLPEVRKGTETGQWYTDIEKNNPVSNGIGDTCTALYSTFFNPFTVTTTAVQNITASSADLSGAVTIEEDQTMSAKGFEWKKTTGGTYAEISDTSAGTSIAASLTGLTANTSYTVRAFVKGGSKTYYGEEKTFTTLLKPVPNAPVNVTAAAPTSTANNNGKLLGVTEEMEYRLNTSSMYIPVTGTEVTGLVPGIYQVRYKGKPGYNAGIDAAVTVPAYTAPSGGGSSSGGSSTSAAPAAANSISKEAEAIKKVAEAIQNLSAADKQEIAKNLREHLPYTLLSGESLTIEQLQKFTNNKFTKEELEIIAKKPELLKALGIDSASLIAVIALKPIQNAVFKDVDASHWANEAIKKAAALGLVSGMPDGSFEPHASLKAADAFTFLDRVLLLNHVTTSTLPRSTVEKYITDKNNWAFNNMASIGSRLSEETLKAVSELGDQPISRELLGQVLYEITQGKLKAVKAVPAFTDTKASPYQAAINYCVSVGLLNGTTETTMSPQKALTRAELMAILIRLDTLLK